MSGRNSTVDRLAQPEPLRQAMKQELQQDDCLPCRIMGASAFMGLGAYSYYSGHRQLRLNQAKILQSKSFIGLKGRQAGVTGIALTLAGMGFWRLVN